MKISSLTMLRHNNRVKEHNSMHKLWDSMEGFRHACMYIFRLSPRQNTYAGELVLDTGLDESCIIEVNCSG